jgi:hypothetical protein
MCTQFADYNEFIREYVVNAYDAAATYCLIKIAEKEGLLLVTIADNGRGMNLNRLKDFLTVFRSRKDHPQLKPVGRHGIGKLSAAAIPGLEHYKVITSTGTECYDFETDSLLEDRPITIRKNSLVPPQGTSFEIGFIKDQSVGDLTRKLYNILLTYVRHLPITIRFDVPENCWPFEHTGQVLPKSDWSYPPEFFGNTHHITLGRKACEVVVAIGSGLQEIYQNKVFITSGYNLFSYGLKTEVRIPNLLIRVDSEAFELPFGRHCLCNEQILTDLGQSIRKRILPAYFNYLTSFQPIGKQGDFQLLLERTDELAIGLLQYSRLNEVWSRYPVFRTQEGSRLSMQELENLVNQKKSIYIEAENSEGIDYEKFDGPVLSMDQVSGAMKYLETVFNSQLINLNNHDTVIDMPPGERSKLTEAEKYFEKHLYFNAKAPTLEDVSGDFNGMGPESHPFKNPFGLEESDFESVSEEARTAENDLRDICWKVGYLVERDGTTPCTRKKFMFRSETMTLNLFHPEIREFVDMSVLNPNLAAHWAIAMCMADNKVLPHISADAREDLLMLDALSRLGNRTRSNPGEEQGPNQDRAFIDFMKNCINRNLRNM